MVTKGEAGREGKLRGWDEYIHTTINKISNQ